MQQIENPPSRPRHILFSCSLNVAAVLLLDQAVVAGHDLGRLLVELWKVARALAPAILTRAPARAALILQRNRTGRRRGWSRARPRGRSRAWVSTGFKVSGALTPATLTRAPARAALILQRDRTGRRRGWSRARPRGRPRARVSTGFEGLRDGEIASSVGGRARHGQGASQKEREEKLGVHLGQAFSSEQSNDRNESDPSKKGRSRKGTKEKTIGK